MNSTVTGLRLGVNLAPRNAIGFSNLVAKEAEHDLDFLSVFHVTSKLADNQAN